MSIRFLTVTAVAMAALSVSAAAARAQPPAPEMSVRINVADLNMRTEAGARVALQRIENAAAVICGREEDIRVLARIALSHACIRRTVDSAIASADFPQLGALKGGAAVSTSVVAAR